MRAPHPFPFPISSSRLIPVIFDFSPAGLHDRSSLPKVQVNAKNMGAKLKLQKKMFGVPISELQLGFMYDHETKQLNPVSCVRENLLQGDLSLQGSCLEYRNSWVVPHASKDKQERIAAGGAEYAEGCVGSRLNFVGGVDLKRGKVFCRFGIKTERILPVEVLHDGLRFAPKFRLGRESGSPKMEVKARVRLPAPQVEYEWDVDTREIEGRQGFGPLEVDLEEVALCVVA
uniref:Uncharacterized protein n=1 Tax=Chromera velia CCMP2878 TaxID=1169474 RepID=A0A0G4I7Q0_9ALVE|eukprot:Cvel_11745.t1-p1 / transcript=Cvel_11745.t1 / gene=Cvel_11745 / organism=Chromera_velia_CCMP2878 / gene_product=hypothetical protein / transcript_product=hypothetical protein / location=Cvel_scaffold746:28760-32318(+) / protein_length=229 / sequence_SO=supercontig / SO=protein_coding / is_pseudo=false